MRTILLLACLAGCSSLESHGATAREYHGTVPVVFTNATPERVCGLYMSYDAEPAYGDNWLPAAGLATGQSAEFRIKPGTYKARWNACKDARNAPTTTFAATLVHETALDLETPTQLFAFVSDGTPPTRRAAPRPHMTIVRFAGQATEITAQR